MNRIINTFDIKRNEGEKNSFVIFNSINNNNKEQNDSNATTTTTINQSRNEGKINKLINLINEFLQKKTVATAAAASQINNNYLLIRNLNSSTTTTKNYYKHTHITNTLINKWIQQPTKQTNNKQNNDELITINK